MSSIESLITFTKFSQTLTRCLERRRTYVQRSIKLGLTRYSYRLSISIALLISPSTFLEVGKKLLIRSVLRRRNRCSKQRRTISTLIIPYQSSTSLASGNQSVVERLSPNSVDLRVCLLLLLLFLLTSCISRRLW